MREVVPALRRVQFFTTGRFANLSDEDCVRTLASDPLRIHFHASPREVGQWTNQERELLLAGEDHDRAWRCDAESVYGAGGFYAPTIRRLQHISFGSFPAEQVTEEWHATGDRESTIHLQFKIGGVARHIWLRRGGDYANVYLIPVLNQWCGAGRRFHDYGTFDDWFIISVSDNDASGLAQRGWRAKPVSLDQAHGILEWPQVTRPESSSKYDAELYFARGTIRFGSGDEAGAWEDWLVADRLGLPALYERAAAVTSLLRHGRDDL